MSITPRVEERVRKTTNSIELSEANTGWDKNSGKTKENEELRGETHYCLRENIMNIFDKSKRGPVYAPSSNKLDRKGVE